MCSEKFKRFADGPTPRYETFLVPTGRNRDGGAHRGEHGYHVRRALGHACEVGPYGRAHGGST